MKTLPQLIISISAYKKALEKERAMRERERKTHISISHQQLPIERIFKFL
jgi:hypothetical protein